MVDEVEVGADPLQGEEVAEAAEGEGRAEIQEAKVERKGLGTRYSRYSFNMDPSSSLYKA